jgi:hypothetical protein
VVTAKVVVTKNIPLPIVWQWKNFGHLKIGNKGISIAKIFDHPTCNNQKLLVTKPAIIKKFLHQSCDDQKSSINTSL